MLHSWCKKNISYIYICKRYHQTGTPCQPIFTNLYIYICTCNLSVYVSTYRHSRTFLDHVIEGSFKMFVDDKYRVNMIGLQN